MGSFRHGVDGSRDAAVGRRHHDDEGRANSVNVLFAVFCPAACRKSRVNCTVRIEKLSVRVSLQLYV